MDLIRVECGGEQHTLRVEGEDLVVLDHEALDERTLQALGGQLPACVVLANVWAGAHRDQRFMTAAVIALAQPGGTGSLRRVMDPAMNRMLLPGPGVRDPALVRAAWESIDGAVAWPAALREQVCACLFGETSPLSDEMLRGAAASWFGFLGGRFDTWQRVPALRDDPVGWVRRVAARCLFIVDGAIVDDVLEETADGLVVSALSPAGGSAPPAAALVRRKGDGWTLTWLDQR